MKTQIIDEIIIRFLDGSATTAEKQELQDWLKESKENLQTFSEMRELWVYSTTDPSRISDVDVEKALQQLKRQAKITATPSRSTFVFRPPYALLRIAATFLLLIGVGYTFYHIGKQSLAEKETVVINRLLTASGGRGHFMLPDSTSVWLNSNSVLEYPSTFTGNSRDVKLEGEAYFEVKRNTAKPFKVHTQTMNIEVLGTHFLVESYSFRKKVETVLLEGSVRVCGNGMHRQITLTPGQMLHYNKESKSITMQMVNTRNYVNWIENQLTFDNTKLEDIIINLEKWFVADIEYSPQLSKNLSLSFSVYPGESLSEILDAMTLIAPIKYHWKGDIVYITPRK